MTVLAIFEFITKFGPAAVQAIPLLAKLASDIKAGRGQQEATPADWAELSRLASLSSASIFVREGVLPPPAA